MKFTSLLSVSLFVLVFSSTAQTGHEGHNHGTTINDPALIQASYRWEESVHDFGRIQQGVPVTATFTFTNTGTQPIVIADARASCGCTVPEFSREPVAPGSTGTVKATFNAASIGFFDKDISVISNASAVDVKLKIKGEVAAE